MKSKHLLTILMAMTSLSTFAQTGTTAYEFLNIPVSAHTAALGGDNVSAIEDDPTLLFSNPSLLSSVEKRSVGFNAMTYMASSAKVSALFATPQGERGSWAIAAQAVNYGKMKETNADGYKTGTFNAADIALQGGYSYLLNDYWAGGAQAKVLYSHYADYSSVGLAVDLGLNYYNEEEGFSFGIVAQNIGRQVDPLYEKNEKLPFNLAAGVSLDLANAPLRLSLTLDDLTHWNRDYYAINNRTPNRARRFSNHITIGADIFPSKQTWVAIGYNFRRGYEMKVNDTSAGLSIGGGLSIKQFRIGVAYAKYHVSASSLMINANLTL